jgi:hypothetical protein
MKQKKPSPEQMSLFCKFLTAEFNKKWKVEKSAVILMLKKYGFGSLNYLLPEFEKDIVNKEKRGIRVFYTLRFANSSIEPRQMWACIDNAAMNIRKYYQNKKASSKKSPSEKQEETEKEFFVEISDLVKALKLVGIVGISIKNKDEKESFLDILRKKAFSFVKKQESYETL